MSDRIEIDVRLDRSVDEVWALVTDPVALGTWMLGTFEFDPLPGSALVFRADGQVRRGEIIEVAAQQRFSWRWNDGFDESEVTIQVDRDQQTCRVRITERLLPPRRWAKPSIPPAEASVA